jgi:hypothetical protein
MLCSHDHAELADIMKSIDNCPDDGQRHICAGCAFYLGVEHRKKRVPLNPEAVDELPESQVAPQKDKDAYQAYKLGYEES